MSEITKILWCDSTVNDWDGCSKISAGCANCYAEARDKRMMIEPVMHWGKGAPRRKSKSATRRRAALNRKPWVCNTCGAYHAYPLCQFTERCHNSMHRRRIFSLSLGDWLDTEIPVEWLAEMLDSIHKADQCIHILCTKRPELWRERLSKVSGMLARELVCGLPRRDRLEWVNEWLAGSRPHNIWLLTSVENQGAADRRIPELMKIPATVRGLSCEPLLGPIDLHLDLFRLDWIIVGGESGPKARPCNANWVRSIKDQCHEAGVPVFVKQFGSNPTCGRDDMCGFVSPVLAWCPCANDGSGGYRVKLNHPKGGDPSEWPKDIRVREFPRDTVLL